ncbi:glycosyltransferase family 4 protein [Streptomonospora sediminis]
MRLLVLAPAYHPRIGGAESYIRTVAQMLAARGHDIVVATDGDGVDAPALDTDAGVQVRRLTRYRRLVEDPTKLRWEQMYFSLTGELAEIVHEWGRPDAVFANSHETAVLGSMLATSCGVPLVANFHEQEPERGPLGAGKTRLIYGRMPIDAMIAGSGFYYDKAVSHGSPEKSTHLIHHGIDCARFATAGPRSGDGRFTIVLSGRIAPRKQQHMMLRVLAALTRRGIDARLVIAGRAHSSNQDYYEDMLALIKELELAERVDVRLDLSLEDMPAVYRECDAVVQPSLAEGLGLAVLEAMAAGRPVVVGDTSGLREVVPDQRVGVCLPPQDTGAWEEALAQLFSDAALRERLAANALSWVRTEFDVERMIDDTERLLESVCASWNYAEND